MSFRNNGTSDEIRRLENLLRRTRQNTTVNAVIQSGGVVPSSFSTSNNYIQSALQSNQNAQLQNLEAVNNSLKYLSFDAFQRLRTSNPVTLFDSQNTLAYKHIAGNTSDDYDTNSDLAWANYIRRNNTVDTSGTGNFNYNLSRGSVEILATENSTSVRQTKQRFRYQPGKSQLIFITYRPHTTNVQGARHRVGYFDDQNGIYFQRYNIESDFVQNHFVIRKTQSPFGTSFLLAQSLEKLIPQDKWNIDKLDGTGPSGIIFNNTSAQILFIDFEWLGVGTVAFGFVINRQFVYCHYEHHSNDIQFVYTATPNLPIRYEVSTPYTGTGDPDEDVYLEAICCSVISEGGFEEGRGFPFTYKVDDGGETVSGETIMFGLAPSMNATPALFASGGYTIIPRGVNILLESIEVYTSQPYQINVYFVSNRATGLVGQTWTEIALEAFNRGSLCDKLDGSLLEFATTMTAHSYDRVLTFFTSAGVNVNRGTNKNYGITAKLPLGHFHYNGGKVLETTSAVIITAVNLGTAGNVHLAVNWKEIY